MVENLEREMILDAYYNPIGDLWMVQDGYLYRELMEELANSIRWSIQREMWILYAREHPFYYVTGV